MICPRCQGLIVQEYGEERCLNCGHRTSFVPPPPAVYRPLPGGFRALPRTQRPRRVPTPQALRRMNAEEQRAGKRAYMRAYMRQYVHRHPEQRAKQNAASRQWRKRKAAQRGASC